MDTFAQKPKATQQTTSTKSTIPGRGHLGQSPEVKSILHLHRTSGNQAVQRMFQTDAGQPESELTGPATPHFGHDFSRIPIHPPAAGAIQTKLVINEQGDSYEQEADRVAEQVMRMPEPQFQRACPCGGGCPNCHTAQPGREQERLQTKRTQASDMGQIAAPPIVHTVLAAPGQPLDMATRLFMEPRFGYDFSQVRVHADATAAESANAVNALAYTAGQDVVFGAGRYAPGTSEGGRLLAHELAHTIQQRPPKTNGGPGSIDLHTGANGVGNQAHGAVRLRAATGLARQAAPPPSPITLPSEGVEMPWVGKGGTNSSELGYLRDPRFFWVRFRAVNPAALSTANNGLINNGGSPVVDDDWIRAYPQHAAYRGQILEHHHVGQGSKAVPIPSGLHDAYTVFHPQRRVVGTPARGTKSLPPQPTHADAQAEIDRHVAAGRIRGQGIAPGSSPRAPAIPPASAVAGVSTQRTAPTSAPPIDAYQGSPMPGPASSMDAYKGSPVGKPASPMEAYKGSSKPEPTTSGAGPLAATSNAQRVKSAARGAMGSMQGYWSMVLAGQLSKVRGAELEKAYDALNAFELTIEEYRQKGIDVTVTVIAEVPNQRDVAAEIAGSGDPSQVVRFREMFISNLSLPSSAATSTVSTMYDAGSHSRDYVGLGDMTLDQQIRFQFGDKYPVPGTEPPTGRRFVEGKQVFAGYAQPKPAEPVSQMATLNTGLAGTWKPEFRQIFAGEIYPVVPLTARVLTVDVNARGAATPRMSLGGRAYVFENGGPNNKMAMTGRFKMGEGYPPQAQWYWSSFEYLPKKGVILEWATGQDMTNKTLWDVLFLWRRV